MGSMALAIGIVLLLGLLGTLIVCSGMNDPVPRRTDAPPVPVEPSSVGAASPPA
jgi:hypothetical protein